MGWRAREVRSLRLWWEDDTQESRASVAWLGQAGFLLRLGSTRIVVDPYLSDSLAEKYRGKKFPHVRMMDAPVQPAEITRVDLVVSTHEHTDHLDPGTLPDLLAANPGAPVVIPRFSRTTAESRGVPRGRQVALSVDETWRADGGVSVTALPAAHEEVVTDEEGNRKFLGYVFEIDGFRVYHSGDTVPLFELESRLENLPLNLALLPSNGRDEERRAHGVPGNLTVEEAIGYHQRFSFETTILHHFGLFAFNTADPEDLRLAIASRRLSSSVIIPDTGSVYEYQE